MKKFFTAFFFTTNVLGDNLCVLVSDEFFVFLRSHSLSVIFLGFDLVLVFFSEFFQYYFVLNCQLIRLACYFAFHWTNTCMSVLWSMTILKLHVNIRVCLQRCGRQFIFILFLLPLTVKICQFLLLMACYYRQEPAKLIETLR